ncbi:MAG: chromosome segregation protein SMC [Zetaproteobacteria bacterium CG12_big_fil_rev_8_21_14_0_65_55_1124]|nr:MAG: chromosome segregation protein SMC [Zetaproteobacteria bacterium CG1_02_55_237]PIS19795.1 MAG: chromosome segregation protein SMC [Zetaproteobacteria bacterium CG08_land_8_20_14_0_20_55_17]PIW42829.1 MAG: chromosome segregation protein SMC [Zetaproteobacteria bacterium CG12_big_fil_rev_8_21_14_0_65_55_1124]PIY51642.1 MAG: chromosome segregation protein SMC [Zetaproteobacteria bacterium CG_4_10_14_0_8_um_filter_55_43]PIZ39815.1 MAG: chromosome segregation protein SMC [Zetaproteobacteria 
MRLKRIELAGFKSFVDPVKVELAEGITAIIGPNGCGKSNIVDAIRWVLGEHSARQLRGGVMDDLIFQGSDTRPPVGVCDVELTFAVQQGKLPSPYHEMEEISIRRRLTREGGSDAFINGKMVRLKDVVDLFLDTGISTRAYAIIEQGSISRMVSAKPEERRAMLEEAAGVMKYRHRRREAERRMQDTRANLERVMDLLEEVRTQCRSLKAQAGRAERFRNLQNEWEDTKALSLGIRLRQHRRRYEKEAAELKSALLAEEEITRLHAAGELQLDEARQKLVAHEEVAQNVQDRLRAAEQQRAEMQRQAERLAGERRLLEERRKSTQQRHDESLKRSEALAAELAALQQRIVEQSDAPLVEGLENAEREVAAAQHRHEAERAERDRLLGEFERLRSQHSDAERRREQAEINLGRLQERQHLLSGRETEIRQQLDAARVQAAELDAAVQADEAHVRAAGESLDKAQQELDDIRQQRNALEEELNARHGEARRLNGDIEALKGRAEAGGIDADVKRQWREIGAVWVDESLQVAEGLDLAVTAALRGQDGDAQLPGGASIDSLRQNLSESRELPAAFHAGSAQEDIRGSLATALGLDAGHPLFAMFAGVLLLDDIAAAPAALDQEARAFAAVSRDGWRMERGGWLVPPAHQSGARRLAAQRDLREKTTQLKNAAAALTVAEQQFADCEGRLAGQQQAWQQAHLAATQAQSDSQSRQAESARTHAEIEALETHLQRLQGEYQELAQQRELLKAQASAEAAPDPAQLNQAEQMLAQKGEAEQAARQQLDQLRNSRAEAAQTLALHRQASDNLHRERNRLQQEADALAARINQDQGALHGLAGEIEQAAQHVQMDEQLRTAADAVEGMHRELNEVRQQGHELQQAALEVERQEHRLRAQLQDRSNQRQQREVALASETARLEDMEQEIVQRCRQTGDALIGKLESMQEEVDEGATLARAAELEERMNRFGPVNLLAIDEYEQAAEREQFLTTQAADLDSSLSTLTETIARIDRTTRQRFKETFDQTNAYFKQLFPRLFGGGRAELRLDSEDLQTAGVEIIAQPPGKRLQDLDLLSGGEKALTAVALVFSIFRIKPAPFCILDEVDAPLDDANVGRFGEMVQEFCSDVQFLNITHNKVSMQMAGRIIGVSMPEPGVSRIVGVDLEAMESAGQPGI